MEKHNGSRVSSNRPAVGLIGLGVMGRGVALNLIEHGFEVFGYDVQDNALEWLNNNGGTPVSSLTQVAENARFVISFVINSDQTDAVLFGDGGLVGSLPAGAVFVACSTMDPTYVKKLSARLAEQSISLIDAPVTGGQDGAHKGTLTVMGSGDQAAFEEIRPLLDAIGTRIYYLGEAGAGAKMKVVNQLLAGANLAVAAEAMALAKHLDLPLNTTLEILSSGAANSWMLGNRGPKMISESFDEVGATVEIFLKDLSLVLDTTRNARFPAPLAHSAYLNYLEAAGRGLGWMDGAVVARNYSLPSS